MVTAWLPDLQLCLLLLVTWSPQRPVSAAYYDPKGYGSGCSDGSTDGLQGERHPGIAACAGSWHGHIVNSSNLCATGWRVCSHQDEQALKTITWKDATALPGCYAINAAQDGGRCRPCISHLEQDDLAGVGRGCPHQSFGQKSCISGGQIDVSCCVDTHFNRACSYRPGLATGVLCCKLPGIPPQVLVRPKSLTHVTTGVTFVLSCQAMGTPTPRVTWRRAGRPLPNNDSRIAVFESGYLLLSQARPEDSDDYQCLVSNVAGDATVNARILVTDHPSGCSDGTTDGLEQYEDIQACAGRWKGHVKRARGLCAKGWHVCNPRHTSLLKLLTWQDVTRTEGCYAYNAANTLNMCTRCHRGDMAGIGRRCGRAHHSRRSCLAEGRVDVYRNKPFSRTCTYEQGHITGVMCCKKLKKRTDNSMKWYKPPRCRPKCLNGGVCVGFNTCKCLEGYKGAWCQNAICPGRCVPNSVCVKPGVCRCKQGYTGPKCQRRDKTCRHPCFYGGRCVDGKCKCPALYYGHACQYVRNRTPKELNQTER